MHKVTFDLFVGKKPAAIDDILVEDIQPLLDDLEADDWWYGRLYDGPSTALSLTISTSKATADSALVNLLSRMDRVTLRATSRATTDKISYVSIPEEYIFGNDSYPTSVGAIKGSDRIGDWLGKRVIHRKAFEGLLHKLSVFSIHCIEVEYAGSPNIRKDGLPFIVELVSNTFFEPSIAEDNLRNFCDEWAARVEADPTFVSQIETIARMKTSSNSMRRSTERFLAKNDLAMELKETLTELKADLARGGALSNQDDNQFAAKFVIEAITNMLGLPFFELVYVANLTLEHRTTTPEEYLELSE